MRILEKPIESPPNDIYSVIKEFTIAEVSIDWCTELGILYREEWDSIHKDYPYDGAVRLWMLKNHPTMIEWLTQHRVDWIGLSSTDYVGYEVCDLIILRMHREEDLVAFRLTWC